MNNYEVFVYCESNQIGDKLGEIQSPSPLAAILDFVPKRENKHTIKGNVVETIHKEHAAELAILSDGVLWTFTANLRS